uniref:Uncharacterized protein n=1 Tax=Arundo donax TaxID=35708 RepID=A0A0A9E7N0_ARUDO
MFGTTKCIFSLQPLRPRGRAGRWRRELEGPTLQKVTRSGKVRRTPRRPPSGPTPRRRPRRSNFACPAARRV